MVIIDHFEERQTGGLKKGTHWLDEPEKLSMGMEHDDSAPIWGKPQRQRLDQISTLEKGPE